MSSRLVTTVAIAFAVLTEGAPARSQPGPASAQEPPWKARLAGLAAVPIEHRERPAQDWLLDRSPFRAAVFRGKHEGELVLSNGLVRRVFRLAPNAATVAFDQNVTGASLLRAVRPEAVVVVNGESFPVGGLVGQPNHAFLQPDWIDAMTADPAALQFVDFEAQPVREAFRWKRVRHHAPDVQWPPMGVWLRLDFAGPPAGSSDGPRFRVSVHYELYDGIPALSKWIELHNVGAEALRLDRFTSEQLAAVEAASYVGGPADGFRTPELHVETDYSFGGGMLAVHANRHAIRWVADPEYSTQVHYQRQTPCLLEVGPSLGPAQDVAPGATFESFRTYELPYDSTDRERRGLAVRRLYRTVAPWVTENPLMMHVRFADRDAVRSAIDQCAEVGFEMVILTFGSGFNIEDESAEYLAKMKEYADYARSKGIEIGGYSLLASRRVGGGHDVVMPEGERPRFGNSPCIESEWGQDYFRKLYQFYETTGFMLLEHDGSYPGDVCIAEHHPGHRALEDSQWNQWRTISGFYRWCREQGVFLNVPDWYYLAGSTKCGMGYRETNWSLPRDQQVIHTRQNVYDGTWAKTPSMGWMFVPLTQYHGGGAAATIEPLDEHRDHYRRMLESNLALGVQACYRGPRLYDTDRTRDLVKSQVEWFKRWRTLLESDVIHGRRADGRDLDWMLHVHPRGAQKGMLVVFNPLPEERRKTLHVDLYYTGLQDRARVRDAEDDIREVELDGRSRARIPVVVPPRGMAWYVIE